MSYICILILIVCCFLIKGKFLFKNRHFCHFLCYLKKIKMFIYTLQNLINVSDFSSLRHFMPIKMCAN